MRTLTVFAERCVHQTVAQTRCDACVRACPRSAWNLNAHGLTFDDAACDQCGLCVAACPSEALALPLPTPLVRMSQAGQEILIACERADSVAFAAAHATLPGKSDSAGQTAPRQNTGAARFDPMDDSKPKATAGVTPCLQALTPYWVMHWAGPRAEIRVRYASGDCQHCNRGRKPAWQDHFATVSAALQTAGRPVPQLQQISFHSWQQEAAQQAAPSSSRRGLFRSLLRPPSTPPATTQPVLMTSARAPLLQLLREQGAGRALWAVELDQKRCTWCLACTQLCDSGALQFIVDTLPPAAPGRTRPLPRSVRIAPGRFTLDMQRCTGCGVCVDACDQLALRNSAAPDPQPSASTHIALDLAHCAQCGVGFHHPRRAPVPAVHPLDAAAAPQVAQICPACRQGRPRQHDRWVQTGEGT